MTTISRNKKNGVNVEFKKEYVKLTNGAKSTQTHTQRKYNIIKPQSNFPDILRTYRM